VGAPIVAGGGPGGGPDGGATGTSAVTVRVFNNSMIPGLAARAANELRQRGWNVVDVGNYPYGVIPESTVYFRPGTEEEGAARALSAQLGVRASPRFEGIENASPGLIVIATSDWGANTD
jgi:hypothetical protein